MDAFFPINKNVKYRGWASLIQVILVYVVLCVITGLIAWFIKGIPVLNTVMNIVDWVARVYSAIGVIFAIIKAVLDK
jgi:thiosulfate reductase cytochrome b subunit